MYRIVLSEVYTWMYGGFEDAEFRFTDFFSSRAIVPRSSKAAVDLGAGSGFQSVPLAKAGFSVTAIDLNENLLNECKNHSGDLPVAIVHDDLMNFENHCESNVELIVCMTDTLVHLESKDLVVELFLKVFATLESDGRFVLTFRDLVFELEGLDRFIPVRSDENTIFTCVLEYEQDAVIVHDIVYVRRESGWECKKSFFRKLRLPSQWVEKQLLDVGFRIDEYSVEQGMITIVAAKR